MSSYLTELNCPYPPSTSASKCLHFLHTLALQEFRLLPTLSGRERVVAFYLRQLRDAQNDVNNVVEGMQKWTVGGEMVDAKRGKVGR